jgi:hypothetical protein
MEIVGSDEQLACMGFALTNGQGPNDACFTGCGKEQRGTNVERGYRNASGRLKNRHG